MFIFHCLDDRHVEVTMGIVGFSTPARTAAVIIARTPPALPTGMSFAVSLPNICCGQMALTKGQTHVCTYPPAAAIGRPAAF
jgi:hypothetical protein